MMMMPPTSTLRYWPSKRSAIRPPTIGGAPRAARVRAVDRRALGVGEAEPAGGDRRDHVEDQERAHAVVAEALPHLREEERGRARAGWPKKRVSMPTSCRARRRERVRQLWRIHTEG